MRHQGTEDVFGRRVLDDVALGKGSRRRPVAPEDAELLRHRKLASAVKGEDFVGTIRCRNCELGRANRVGARCFDRAQ